MSREVAAQGMSATMKILFPAVAGCLALGMALAPAHADRSRPGRTKPAPETPPADAPPAPPAVPAAVPPAPAPPAPPRSIPVPAGRVESALPPAALAPGAPMPLTPASPAPAPVGPPGKAEITDLVHDAGTVDRGTEITHSFAIKNIGEHDLTVDAKASCGCTVAQFDKIIAPGQVGHVKAVVQTANFKGPINKSVTVTTNDPANARLSLQMKANVAVPVDVQPGENMSFSGKAGQIAAQKVTISSTDQSPFDLISATPSAPGTAVRVLSAGDGGAVKTAPGKLATGANRYEVEIGPGADIPVGRLNETVTIKTTHPKAPDVLLKLFGTITGDVEVNPMYVTLATGATAAPEARAQRVTIRKPSGDPLEIRGVTSDNPALDTQITTVEAGRAYDLEVRFAGAPPQAPFTAKIHVLTNDARQPSLEVQVWGRADVVRPPVAGIAPMSTRPTAAPAPPPPPAPTP